MLQWVPGQKNIAHAFTKRNVVMYRVLNLICRTGTIDPELFTTTVKDLQTTKSHAQNIAKLVDHSIQHLIGLLIISFTIFNLSINGWRKLWDDYHKSSIY